jgi:hypothetical protein
MRIIEVHCRRCGRSHAIIADFDRVGVSAAMVAYVEILDLAGVARAEILSRVYEVLPELQRIGCNHSRQVFEQLFHPVRFGAQPLADSDEVQRQLGILLSTSTADGAALARAHSRRRGVQRPVARRSLRECVQRASSRDIPPAS